MYAVANNGSPRKGGNTEIMLQEVLGELQTAGWETELVKVGGTDIRGCIACTKCFENKDLRCAVKKDKFNDIFARLLKADAMIMGSPTYFAAISGDLKALIERAGFVVERVFPVENMPIFYKFALFRAATHKVFDENMARKEGYRLSPLGQFLQTTLMRLLPDQFCNIYVLIARKPKRGAA